MAIGCRIHVLRKKLLINAFSWSFNNEVYSVRTSTSETKGKTKTIYVTSTEELPEILRRKLITEEEIDAINVRVCFPLNLLDNK